jgi:hypothetical protein
MSPRLSAPNRDPAAVSEKERREMRQESDAELLKVRATGNECKKRAGSRGASASRRRPQCADREMDGCRLDYCARRLDYCHYIRPLECARDFLTFPRDSRVPETSLWSNRCGTTLPRDLKRRKSALLEIEGGATWDRAQMDNSPRARVPSTDSPSDLSNFSANCPKNPKHAPGRQPQLLRNRSAT